MASWQLFDPPRTIPASQSQHDQCLTFMFACFEFFALTITSPARRVFLDKRSSFNNSRAMSCTPPRAARLHGLFPSPPARDAQSSQKTGLAWCQDSPWQVGTHPSRNRVGDVDTSGGTCRCHLCFLPSHLSLSMCSYINDFPTSLGTPGPVAHPLSAR